MWVREKSRTDGCEAGYFKYIHAIIEEPVSPFRPKLVNRVLGLLSMACTRCRGGMKPEMAKQLKAFEKENARLKKMVAEQALAREFSRRLPG